MQTIIYNGRYAVLYRGGYDKENRKGLDPYQRCRNPFQRDPKSEIAEGFLLHTSSLKEKADKFFGYPNDNRDQYIDGHWKVCFDAQARLVLFDASLKNPKRIVEKSKTRSKKFQEWTRYGQHATGGPPWVYHGWKFKDPGDYLIIDIDVRWLYKLLPDEAEKIIPEPWNYDYQKVAWELWELDPINLDDSWDWSDQKKLEIAAYNDSLRALERKKREELEILKKTPGHCCICGAPGAKLSAIPGSLGWGDTVPSETFWICERCWNDRYENE